MIITRRSSLTERTNQMNIPIKQKEYNQYRLGTPLEQVAPQLTISEIEFLENGITPKEYSDWFNSQ